MENTNKNDNIVCFLEAEPVKNTILQSKSGKIIEIENRVDPKLWYKRSLKNLQDEYSVLKSETIRQTFGAIALCLICLVKVDFFGRIFTSIVVILLSLLTVLNIDLLNCKYKNLKEYKEMKPIVDDYFSSYNCLNINSYDYDFLESLEEVSLVDFCEIDGAIRFNYIDSKGDYCVRDIKVDVIRKNIHAPHTKIIMHENHLEYVIPYKLQEKAPEQSGADD